MQPYKHPSGIDLSSIPATQHTTARDVLAAVAGEIDKEMRLIAKSWKTCIDGGTSAARDKALYDGLNFAVGRLQEQWYRAGLRGNILAIMPPTDGFDENGKPRDGIAEYCQLIEQDIPW